MKSNLDLCNYLYKNLSIEKTDSFNYNVVVRRTAFFRLVQIVRVAGRTTSPQFPLLRQDNPRELCAPPGEKNRTICTVIYPPCENHVKRTIHKCQ